MSQAQAPISAYDFDGTITNADTFLLFGAYAAGKWRMIRSILAVMPQILAMKAGMMDSGKVKERLFSRLFKGMSVEQYTSLCNSFATANRGILRPRALESISHALSAGHKVAIVTASLEDWVTPFFQDMPVTIIGTVSQVRDGAITGKFASLNCRGAEKVRRFHEIFPPGAYSGLTYYGDSKGDKQMLELADYPIYQPFR